MVCQVTLYDVVRYVIVFSYITMGGMIVASLRRKSATLRRHRRKPNISNLCSLLQHLEMLPQPSYETARDRRAAIATEATCGGRACGRRTPRQTAEQHLPKLQPARAPRCGGGGGRGSGASRLRRESGGECSLFVRCVSLLCCSRCSLSRLRSGMLATSTPTFANGRLCLTT